MYAWREAPCSSGIGGSSSGLEAPIALPIPDAKAEASGESGSASTLSVFGTADGHINGVHAGE